MTLIPKTFLNGEEEREQKRLHQRAFARCGINATAREKNCYSQQKKRPKASQRLTSSKTPRQVPPARDAQLIGEKVEKRKRKIISGRYGKKCDKKEEGGG